MTRVLACILVTCVLACSGGASSSTCDAVAQTGCASGQVCETVAGGPSACFAAVLVRGTVADLATAASLNGARVVALDANRAPLSTVQVTANDGTTDGAYELKLARVARADTTGKPAQASITLRADKQAYQTFPGGLRTALPIGGTNVGATPVTVTTATPTFAWQKGNVDSSAATYRILVFDSFGNEAWSHDMAATATDSIPYAGAALQAGMTYQLRILAIKEAIPVPATYTQLSQTEDVAGVFAY